MLTSVRSLLAASVLATSFAAAPAFADETDVPKEITVSGNVALVTDYRFRGLSLSDGDFALQGGITVTHSSGFYVGTWASSIKDSPATGELETDFIAGWSGEVSSGVTLDAGLTYYVYPNGKVGHANVMEPYVSVAGAVGPATVKVGAAYAWKQKSLDTDGNGTKNDNLYVYTDVGVGIPETPISLSAHLGYTDGALGPKFLTGGTKRSGFDYSLGATYNITPQLSAGISYVGVDGHSIDSYSNDAVVGTLKLSF